MPAGGVIPTSTPLDLLLLPNHQALLTAFKGKKLDSVRTPAAVIDRGVFVENCERVVRETKGRGMGFRAHVKTHKTLEGTRLQCQAAGGVSKLICSTLVEVHQVVAGGLVDEGLVDDILYSMPIGPDKIPDLAALQSSIGEKATIRLMVDHPAQIAALDAYNADSGRAQKWAVFVKVDGGGRRAGVPPESGQMKKLLQSIQASKSVEVYGFYSHFGHSYASDSLATATDYFQAEVACVNSAAKLARSLGLRGEWTLSVGATPTAHAATAGKIDIAGLEGSLELHAGNYCITDLQQYATSLVPVNHLALTILTSVVSLYPHRDEALCDAGGLCVSKDTGPIAGYGDVISPNGYGWRLGKVSQEHGILVRRKRSTGGEGAGGETLQAGIQLDMVDVVQELKVGDRLSIVPQHACLVLASQPWIYVVDGGDEVVDVWVPWKGW